MLLVLLVLQGGKTVAHQHDLLYTFTRVESAEKTQKPKTLGNSWKGWHKRGHI